MSKCHSFSLKSDLRSIAMAQIQDLKYGWIMVVQNPVRAFLCGVCMFDQLRNTWVILASSPSPNIKLLV